MNDDKLTTMLFDITGKLSSIETKLDSVSENLLKHEARITNLETKLNKHIEDVLKEKKDTSNDASNSGSTLKDEILKLLAKAVVIALTAIVSLTGAAGLLSKIIPV